jgi:hypothetical protein
MKQSACGIWFVHVSFPHYMHKMHVDFFL